MQICRGRLPLSINVEIIKLYRAPRDVDTWRRLRRIDDQTL
jgi:hypothetical protein